MKEQRRTRKELFELWAMLKEDIQIISGIVQNEMLITEEMIQDWHNRIERVRHKISRLELETASYLSSELAKGKK